MTLPYATLDVFTDRPLAGNPLAVVLGAERLKQGEMQAIAREFNLTETVFVLPPENPLHNASVRIFTPTQELPFAGHPTVGVAVLLGLRRAAGSAGVKQEMVLVLEERIGLVRCGVTIWGSKSGYAVFDLPRQATEVGPAGEREAVAAAMGLVPSEVGFENHLPGVFSAGLDIAFVPVRNLAAIGRARPVDALWQGAFGNVEGVYIYCRETERSGRHFHARMFVRELGIVEDPATGVAVAAFAGVIRKFDEPTAGLHCFAIEQGFEMGRPSLIDLEIDIEDGRVAASRIGGPAVVIAEGELDLG